MRAIYAFVLALWAWAIILLAQLALASYNVHFPEKACAKYCEASPTIYLVPVPLPCQQEAPSLDTLRNITIDEETIALWTTLER